jgi:hypothetical protein
MDDRGRARAALMAERRTATKRLADLRTQLAAIEGRGARVASEIGPARYLAELLGWDDGESAVKLISAILVLTIDPAAERQIVGPENRKQVSWGRRVESDLSQCFDSGTLCRPDASSKVSSKAM